MGGRPTSRSTRRARSASGRAGAGAGAAAEGARRATPACPSCARTSRRGRRVLESVDEEGPREKGTGRGGREAGRQGVESWREERWLVTGLEQEHREELRGASVAGVTVTLGNRPPSAACARRQPVPCRASSLAQPTLSHWPALASLPSHTPHPPRPARSHGRHPVLARLQGVHARRGRPGASPFPPLGSALRDGPLARVDPPWPHPTRFLPLLQHSKDGDLVRAFLPARTSLPPFPLTRRPV